MTRQETVVRLRSIVLLSGLDHDNYWELANQYWPDPYAELIVSSPWLLVRTPRGMIEIGRRKKVISISWDDTPLRKIVTSDDVTKNETLVHAWSESKAVEYLTIVADELKRIGAES